MYKLIYDYIGEESYDNCYGIEETFNTWSEAHENMLQCKDHDCYCHFNIVRCDEN